MDGQMSNDPNKPSDDRLDTLLNGLRDMPVSSNFTARVMQQIEREAPLPSRSRALRWNMWLHRFLPRAVVAAVLLTAGLFTMHTRQVHQRTELAHDLVTVSKVDPLTDPNVLVNLDAIKRLSQQSPADDEILALMQ
jgi:hypothetical protein